jgi:drug/metabolite transporter (DMT)-like permease
MTHMSKAAGQTTNLQAILLMLVSMGGFAFTDTIIKLAAEQSGVGQIIVFQGVFGSMVFGLMLLRARKWFTRDMMLDRMVVLRTSGDILAITFIIMALKFLPVGTVAAILQTQPLMLTVAAIVFLKERVSWFRWGAIALGLVGALIIIQPGTDSFDSASLMVIVGVVGLTLRDLCTRMLDSRHSTLVVSAFATLAIIPAGIVLHIITDSQIALDPKTLALLILAGVTGALSYFAIVLAMRVGEVSAIAPFRYSRLVAAFVIAYLILGERPDLATLGGSALIVVAGLVVFYRENRKSKAAPSNPT